MARHGRFKSHCLTDCSETDESIACTRQFVSTRSEQNDWIFLNPERELRVLSDDLTIDVPGEDILSHPHVLILGVDDSLAVVVSCVQNKAPVLAVHLWSGAPYESKCVGLVPAPPIIANVLQLDSNSLRISSFMSGIRTGNGSIVLGFMGNIFKIQCIAANPVLSQDLNSVLQGMAWIAKSNTFLTLKLPIVSPVCTGLDFVFSWI